MCLCQVLFVYVEQDMYELHKAATGSSGTCMSRQSHTLWFQHEGQIYIGMKKEKKNER